MPTDGDNELLAQALTIGDPAAAAHSGAQRTGGEAAAQAPDPAAGSDNPNGSFERFMSSFGSPKRWAGR